MIPSGLIFVIFVFSFILFSLVGFYVMRMIVPFIWYEHLTIDSIGISNSVLSVLSIFVSIPLTFIIISIWNNYNNNLTLIKQQAHYLLQLHQALKALGFGDPLVYDYLHSKNNFEQIYDFKPTPEQQVRYDELLITYNQFKDTTIAIASESNDVSAEIWSVIILGVVTVIIGTWLVKSPFYLHLYLIISVAAVLGSLVFLVYFYSFTHECSRCLTQDIYDSLKQQVK